MIDKNERFSFSGELVITLAILECLSNSNGPSVFQDGCLNSIAY